MFGVPAQYTWEEDYRDDDMPELSREEFIRLMCEFRAEHCEEGER